MIKLDHRRIKENMSAKVARTTHPSEAEEKKFLAEAKLKELEVKDKEIEISNKVEDRKKE
jgi:hypothetical protein